MITDISFDKRDYEELMYNLSLVPPGKDILSFFAPLNAMPEFAAPIIVDGKTIDKNQVIKYVVILYDRNSKYNVCKDALKMRENAAVCAGWLPDKKTGYFPDYADKIMRGLVPSVNRMIIRYARIYYSIEYTSVVSDLIAWSKVTDDLTGEIKVKDDNDDAKQRALKIMQERKYNLEKNIAVTLKKILSEDNNPYLKKELFRMLEDDADGIVLSPEKMAGVGVNGKS
jgi:hypothetical protein